MKKKFEFKPTQFVLVRDNDQEEWVLSIYSHRSADGTDYCGDRCEWKYIIPFEGNEYLIGTANPYVEKYVPQDGDFIAFGDLEGGRQALQIFKSFNGDGSHYVYVTLPLCLDTRDYEEKVDIDEDFEYSNINIRPATEEEKNQLISKLHKVGKDWNAENKQIVGYEKPYVPQDGHLVVSGWKRDDGREAKWLALVKGDFEKGYYDTYAGVFLKKNNESTEDVWIGEYCDAQDYTIAATEEDKKYFFDKLHEIGKDWSAEKKEIVDWKWEPQELDPYWYPSYYAMQGIFYPQSTAYQDDELDDAVKARGQMCRTKEECQALCDKLNAALKNI